MKAFITLFCFIMLPGAGYSQALLTLEQAVAIGLQNNYGILIAGNEAKIASNNATPGNAGIYPVIDGSAGYSMGVSNAKVTTISGQELNGVGARSDLATAGVNLRWRLFDGMNMFVTYDKLKVLEEMGELQAEMEIENSVASIIVAYYNIIRQEITEQILQEQVGISQFRVDLALLRYETGSGSELEWLKARVELNSDRSELAMQATETANSRTYLNELLARDVSTPVNVSDTIPLQDTLRLDTIRRWMKYGNIRLHLAEKSVVVSGKEVKSARAQQIPFIDFMVGYNYFRNENAASFLNYNRYFGPTVGLSAGVRIFDGMNLHRQYLNARISLINSELAYDQLLLRLDAWLYRVYNDYRNQLDQVGFERENLVLATRNMDLAKESYLVGAISSIDLREIQKNLLEARQRYLTARFLTKVKETELLLSGGRLVD